MPRRIVLAAALLAGLTLPTSAVAATGNITSVIGTGSAGFNGDATAGNAGSAQLYLPIAMVPRPGGGFLIADQGNNAIREYVGGALTTVAGSPTVAAGYSGDTGPATSATMNAPSGVAATADGGFLIADSNNNVVRKVLGGTITTVAGTGAAGYDGEGAALTKQLSFPSDVVATPDGGFLIADADNHRIRKVLNGTISTVVGTGAQGHNGDGDALTRQLDKPAGVALAPDGFYFSEAGNRRVRKVVGTAVTTVAGSGTPGIGGDGGQAVLAQLSAPQKIAAHPDGGFVVADRGANVVRRVDGAGVISTVTGTGIAGYSNEGGAASGAQVNQPYGVAVDGGRDIYVADTLNHRVRIADVGDPSTLDTIIDSGPSGFTNAASHSFGFSATAPLSTFQCKVDGAAFGPCTTGTTHTTGALPDGPHTFSVVATAGADTDPTPATRTFTIDTVVPSTAASVVPTVPQDNTQCQINPRSCGDAPSEYFGPVTVKVAGSDDRSGVVETRCVLDPPPESFGFGIAPAWAHMTGCPFLGDGATVAESGAHTVYFASKDAAGGIEPTRKREFNISVRPAPPPAPTAAPNTSITATPLTPSIDTRAQFQFLSDKPGSSFECKLNAARNWTACKSPHVYSGLSPGSHTFQVRAIAGGLTDPTPALHRWDVGEPPKGDPVSKGSCVAAPPGQSSNPVFAVTSILIRPEPASLTSQPGIPWARWSCTVAAGTCPALSVCDARGQITVTDRQGDILKHPLYGAIGSCARNPVVGIGEAACWDDFGCYAETPGICRRGGTLVDVTDQWAYSNERRGTGEIPLWARCSMGRKGTRVPPSDGHAACNVTFTARSDPMAYVSAVIRKPTGATGRAGILLKEKGVVTVTTVVSSRKLAFKANAKAKVQKPAIGAVRLTVRKAGVAYFPLKLNAAAKKLLDGRGYLSTTVTVRFQPARGGPARTRVLNKTLWAVRTRAQKACPKTAKTRRARAKCVVLPAVKKAKKR